MLVCVDECQDYQRSSKHLIRWRTTHPRHHVFCLSFLNPLQYILRTIDLQVSQVR
jgi:hypothetical protein